MRGESADSIRLWRAASLAAAWPCPADHPSPHSAVFGKAKKTLNEQSGTIVELTAASWSRLPSIQTQMIWRGTLKVAQHKTKNKEEMELWEGRRPFPQCLTQVRIFLYQVYELINWIDN